MSTEYRIIKKLNKELCLLESSNLLSVCLYENTANDEDGVHISRLTPIEVEQAAVKMLRAASYYVDDSRAFLAKYNLSD